MIYSPAKVLTFLTAKRARIGNHELFVPLPLDTLGSWTKLRIGMMWRIGHQGDNNTGIPVMAQRPRIAFGLASGVANGVGGPSNCHFAGYGMFDTPSSGSNYLGQVANSDAEYCVTANTANWFFMKRENTTETLTAAAGFAPTWQTADNNTVTEPVSNIVTLSFSKGAPNWTLQAFVGTSTTSSLNLHQKDTFIRVMECGYSNEFIRGNTASGRTNGTHTLAIDEGTYGVLNSLYFWWGIESPPIYIDAFAIRKIGA